ncbi:hypothetical protein, partial [Escherichia coli]|uniref:hypothetical protein n=1 Tax=Escherichia coli TaxID=562 RepID=UPI00208DA42D
PQGERKQEIGAVIVIDNGRKFDVLITLRIEQQLGLNALTLTDITKNAAYGVDIGSLVLEINNPAA